MFVVLFFNFWNLQKKNKIFWIWKRVPYNTKAQRLSWQQPNLEMKQYKNRIILNFLFHFGNEQRRRRYQQNSKMCRLIKKNEGIKYFINSFI